MFFRLTSNATSWKDRLQCPFAIFDSDDTTGYIKAIVHIRESSQWPLACKSIVFRQINHIFDSQFVRFWRPFDPSCRRETYLFSIACRNGAASFDCLLNGRRKYNSRSQHILVPFRWQRIHVPTVFKVSWCYKWLFHRIIWNGTDGLEFKSFSTSQNNLYSSSNLEQLLPITVLKCISVVLIFAYKSPSNCGFWREFLSKLR